jgi:hypothetical protein
VTSKETAKETLRRAIFEAWNSKLRALGFRGGKSSRMHRVLLDDDRFPGRETSQRYQVLELQWSRFNADDDARVRVHVGVGRVSALRADQKPHLDHCFLTYAPMQSRDADDNWIRFREGESEAELVRMLNRDYREAWLPFFNLTAHSTFSMSQLEGRSIQELVREAMPLRLV